MSAYALDNGRDREFQRAFKKAVIISLAFHCAVVLAMAVSAMFGEKTESMPRTMPVSLMSAAPGPPPSKSTAVAPPDKKEEKKTLPTPPPKKPEPKPEPKPKPPPQPEKKEEPKKGPDKKLEKKTISPKKEEVVKKKDKQEKKKEEKKEEVRKETKPEKTSSPATPEPPAKKDTEIAKNDAPSALASNPDIEAARRLQGPPGVEGGTSSRAQWNSAMEVIEKDPRMKVYQGTVGGYIRDYWVLPPSVPEGQGLHVDVMIKVDQNGNVLDYEIVHESGHADFDQSVKDLLKNIERIPSVPVQVPGGELELPLRFIPEGYDY